MPELFGACVARGHCVEVGVSNCAKGRRWKKMCSLSVCVFACKMELLEVYLSDGRTPWSLMCE